MIESATARRAVGDWAGACAAARVDVELRLRSVAHAYGQELATRVRADLRQLAPDLLRWHLPRIAPDGLLRPGLTMTLARYDRAGDGDGGPVHLVARTPPAWADAGQRLSLALWDGARSGDPHPHPHPDRRFRLDLHRHLWDTRRSGELRDRSGADRVPDDGHQVVPEQELLTGRGYAVYRWAAEAGLVLRAHGRAEGEVAVRLGVRRRLVLRLVSERQADGRTEFRVTGAAPAGRTSAVLPELPDAATWVLPDLALLQAGLIDADQLHPLVAAALLPDQVPTEQGSLPENRSGPRLVECRGVQHRIALVDGVLVPLDHEPAELRREELLTALGGTPLPCLQAIDTAHRRPESLVDIRARLDHGDTAGALAAVEALLGPGAVLRGGALRDELHTAAHRRITHGLFRAGLAGAGRGPASRLGPRRHDQRAHPRHATCR